MNVAVSHTSNTMDELLDVLMRNLDEMNERVNLV